MARAGTRTAPARRRSVVAVIGYPPKVSQHGSCRRVLGELTKVLKDQLSGVKVWKVGEEAEKPARPGPEAGELCDRQVAPGHPVPAGRPGVRRTWKESSPARSP